MIGLFQQVRPKPRPAPHTEAHLTTSGGDEQAVRLHLARAEGGVHAVLQYRSVGEREWASAMQTVCGLRDFTLCDAYGEWCKNGGCYTAWMASRRAAVAS